jgi:anthranilate phosphoribosyltransferase
VIPDLLHKLSRHEDLTADEAAAAMEHVMTGQATAAQLAGLLMGLLMKGERPEEIVGLARTMRAHATELPRQVAGVFDTCGTGGDRSGTVNISSAAAVIVAACGVPVAKHGNRSVSSRCGSADVFEALGVDVAMAPDTVVRGLEDAHIAFLFAPAFHPSMKHAASARRELGLRTAFNLLGPLTNPARPARQLIGVPRPELTELLARALLMLGSERVWVVHGADGLDEISTTGYTKVSEGHEGSVRTFYIHPGDYGIAKVGVEALAGGDASVNAAALREVLSGAHGPRRDVALLNAGAALLIAGRVGSVREGLANAADAVDSGRALETLGRLTALSPRTADGGGR